MVTFPAGTYLSKPLTLRTKTTLQLDAGATLKAMDEPKDFCRRMWPGMTFSMVQKKARWLLHRRQGFDGHQNLWPGND